MATRKVKFKRMRHVDYQVLPSKDADTLYFILDKPFIYMGSVQYGIELDSSKHVINSVSFDSETNELIIGVLNGKSERIPIIIKKATSSNDGLMSKENVATLEKVSSALEGIDNVKNYVNKELSSAAIEPNWYDI